MKHEARRTTRGASAASLSALRLAFVLLGFTALTVQIILLRELMVAWRGNEMSLGIVLSVWLTLTALGSALFGKVSRGTSFTPAAVAWSQIGLGVASPLALIAARTIPGLMRVSPGEVAGLSPLVVASVLSLLVFTLLSGFTFALSVSVLHGQRHGGSGAIGHVYVLEAIGAAAAGVLSSFVLLERWEPTRIVFLTSALAAAMALVIAWGFGGRTAGRSRWKLPACAITLLVASLALLGPPGRTLDTATLRWALRELGFTTTANSIYGRIVTTRRGSQVSVYENGVLVASAPDRLSAEEAVHIPMLMHQGPSRVLLLGGGLGGAVSEVLKHPGVESVDYVELDPAVIEIAGREFGACMTSGFDDPRVHVHFTDARFFVKRSTGTYDVVIVNVTGPTTARLNRVFTVEFFRESRRIMAPDGIIGLAIPSSENYISGELAAFLACIRRSLGEAFPEVVVTPGDPCHLIAGNEPGRLTRDPERLASAIAERKLDTRFIRDYYLRFRFTEERIDYLDEAIQAAQAPINTDLTPVCYYLGTVLWNSQFGPTPAIFRAAPRLLTLRNICVLALAVVLAVGLPGLRRPRSAGALRRRVIAAVVIVGATEITLEVASLLAFQSLYGFVYHRLALLIAAFMGGLAVGGRLGEQAVRHGAGERSFALVQLGICLIPLALASAVLWISGLPPDALWRAASFFPLLVVASAVLAGMQFPLAAKLCLDRSGRVGAVGGRLYASDLFGSAAGATLSSVFLIPLMGIVGTMQALSVLNAAVLICLVLPLIASRKKGA